MDFCCLSRIFALQRKTMKKPQGMMKICKNRLGVRFVGTFSHKSVKQRLLRHSGESAIKELDDMLAKIGTHSIEQLSLHSQCSAASFRGQINKFALDPSCEISSASDDGNFAVK